MAFGYHLSQVLQSRKGGILNTLLHKVAEAVADPFPQMLVPAQGNTVLFGPALQTNGIHEHIIISVGVRVV